jgi:hypothetical protein
MTTEQIAVTLRESLHIASTSDEEGDDHHYRRSSMSSQRPPIEIIIMSPSDSPSNDAPPPPPPPPPSKRFNRRGTKGIRGVGNKVESVRPNEANKVLGFTDRSKTAVAKLFTKIPVVSTKGAAGMLAKRIRNAKAKEQQRSEAEPVSSNGSAKSGRSSVLAKAANFLTHSITAPKESKTKNHVKPVDSKTPIPQAPAVVRCVWIFLRLC